MPDSICKTEIQIFMRINGEFSSKFVKISKFFVSRRLFHQSHNCINQMGTYTCDCNAGYEISKKGRDTACQGFF